jgi:2',3'-cyclic-nucleotide 2'-phosphodiesterase (5'-nucleotidase family)
VEGQLSNASLGTSLVDLPLSDLGSGFSKLALFIGSAMNAVTQSVCSLVNHRGIRGPINKGVITVKDLLSIDPFPDRVYVLNLSGKLIYEMIAQGVSSGKPTSTVAGVHFTLDQSKAPKADGRIVNVTIVDLNGEFVGLVKKDAYYPVSVLSYLYDGGDMYAMLDGMMVSDEGRIIDVLSSFLQNLPDRQITDDMKFYRSGYINTIGKPHDDNL